MMTLLYLGGAYLVIGAILVFVLFKRRYVDRKSMIRRLPIVLFLVLLPVFPYIIVEYRTWQYKDIVLPAVHQSLKALGSNEPILFFKIMRVEPQHISVYVVTPCTGEFNLRGRQGEMIELIKKPDRWIADGMDHTVWTDCGTADNSTFPPYP